MYVIAVHVCVCCVCVLSVCVCVLCVCVLCVHVHESLLPFQIQNFSLYIHNIIHYNVTWPVTAIDTIQVATINIIDPLTLAKYCIITAIKQQLLCIVAPPLYFHLV